MNFWAQFLNKKAHYKKQPDIIEESHIYVIGSESDRFEKGNLDSDPMAKKNQCGSGSCIYTNPSYRVSIWIFRAYLQFLYRGENLAPCSLHPVSTILANVVWIQILTFGS